MSVKRTTALVSMERQGFGGSYHDSYTHNRLFQSMTPYNFGVKMAKTFAQELETDIVNKLFTFYTMAKGNTYALPGGTDDYTWYAGFDAEPEFRFTELLVDPAGYAGKGNLPFKIACDKNWLHEPAIIKLGGYGLPLLRILGQPTVRSANSFEYEVVIQDGDPNTYIPVSELRPDKTFVRVSSGVSDELNQKFAPDQYGDMYKLQSWTSNYANKAEFTDKFIRAEIAAKKSGQRMNGMSYSIEGKTFSDGCVGKGYTYQANMRGEGGKVIPAGVFITAVEARLEERTQMDREMMMKFGRLEKTVDRDSGRPIKFAPGWDQLVRDGQFLEHNGSLSLDGIFEWLNNLFMNRRGFKDRYVVLSGGTGAISWLSKKIYAEYASLLSVDSHFVSKNSNPTGVHSNELSYGAMFTEIKLPMGITVSIEYDPSADNTAIHKTMAPGTNYTQESFCINVYDFGKTNYAGQGARGENMTMIYQDGVESFYTVSNVYDFTTGAEKSGGNVHTNSKELGVYREMSGSLGVWDTERIGRIEFNPFI